MNALLLALLACSGGDKDGPAGEIPEPYDPPDLAGPWAVGAATRSFVDREDDDGTMDVWVWFPASEAGTEPASYDGLGEGRASTDASPDCAEPRPVVVFSHASGGVAAQSWFLAERLASHGWVGVAPTHSGTTREDLDLTDLPAAILRRPVELGTAFDGLVNDTALAGCVDAEAGYAVVGHDLGGSTALLAAGATLEGAALGPLCEEQDSLACELLELGLGGDDGASLSLQDPRVWAAFAMAPTDLALDAGGLANVTAPVGVLGATLDAGISWDEVLAPTFDALTVTPRGLGGVEGAGHLSLSALCPLYAGWPECEEGGAYLPVQDAWEAVNVTAVPVLEVLRGEARAAAYLPPERAAVSWGWED